MEGDYLNIYNKNTGMSSKDIINCNHIPTLQYVQTEIEVQITRIEETLKAGIESKELDEKKVQSLRLAIRLQDVLLTQVCAKIMYLEAPLIKKIERLKSEVKKQEIETNYWKGIVKSLAGDKMQDLCKELDSIKLKGANQ